MKILICDDAMLMRHLLENMLKGMGHEVIGTAGNGAEAIQKYKKLKPDLVTMDITMPVVTGLEALTSIKIYDPKAKVIMCSAMGQEHMIIDALKEGAIDFIIKPFQENRVREAINKVLTLQCV